MAVCEMCGRESVKLVRVRIENAVLMVGPECVRFGKPFESPSAGSRVNSLRGNRQPVSRAAKVAPVVAKRERADELDEMRELASDYPKRILTARNAMGLKQEELASRLNEKKSVIKDLEAGKLVPPDSLVRKIEKLLKIKLTEETKYEYKMPQAKKRELTLGDFLEK
ncbi:MAG: TIGR00270 family protein [Thermoplasmata archaeon]|uniref:TIGR00270 family protein n=1 Tax=Candidatus Sysuiplasma superficiale TaxID=2823368 RepID=A0A8J7YNR0_9ARCH|nr:TIGR00270 family protein [Candidatus Sysuiplasma superficiale]MBX8644118.1 TIGR00270 family protein [Candidatus Sysuiplasma superficiale]